MGFAALSLPVLDWDGLGLDGLDEPDCMDCDGFGMNDLAIVAFSGPSCGGLTWDTLVLMHSTMG